MTTKIGYGLAVLATLALAACGKNHDAAQEASNDTSSTVSTDSLKGTFTSGCQTNLVGALAGLGSYVVTYNITGALDKSTTYYASLNCAAGSDALTIDTSGIYVPHGNLAAAGVPADTAEVDFTWQKEVVTPKSQALVDAMNLANYCAVNNWSLTAQPNTPPARDVSPAAGQANCFGTDKLVTIYDLMNTQNNQLTFGQADATHDKSTPAARPAAIDPTVVATRVN